MGNAFICRRGGGSILRELTLVSMPAKTTYYAGQYADISGAKVNANFGGTIIPIDCSGIYSPTRPLTASDTAITVTATFGSITKTLQIPIHVYNASTTFGDNSWDEIAYIASIGEANNFWSVGDSKTENGITYTIIGMGHDKLSTTDAKYRDTSYNGNTKKAALTLQVMTAAGPAPMNQTATNAGGWDESYMRGTAVPNYLASMPADLRAVMRTVDKITSTGGEDPGLTTSRDQMFLLAASELKSLPAGYFVPQAEQNANPMYSYYANGGEIWKGSIEWTRSPYHPANEYGDPSSRFCCNHGGEYLNNGPADDGYTHYFYPAFCI